MALCLMMELLLTETVTFLLVYWLPTAVPLSLFWLVATEGRVLEMAVALLVLLMERLQSVQVSANSTPTLSSQLIDQYNYCMGR